MPGGKCCQPNQAQSDDVVWADNLTTMSEETLADATNNLLVVPGASREQQDFPSHVEIEDMKHFWLFWCTAVMEVASWRRRNSSAHPADGETILVFQPRRQQQVCAIAQICISVGSQHFCSQHRAFSRGWSSLNTQPVKGDAVAVLLQRGHSHCGCFSAQHRFWISLKRS